MTKDEALAMFGGNARSLADALGITEQAVSQWGESVPRLRELQIIRLTERKSAMDILMAIEDAASHLFEANKSIPAFLSGRCLIDIYPEGFNVSCTLTNRNEEIALGKSILYAENRMISYHAVEASKTNILIDAIDAVVRSVTNDASEFGN